MKKEKENKSRYWDRMSDLLDESFPKGESKERGAAIVMIARVELMLQEEEGTIKEFTDNIQDNPQKVIDWAYDEIEEYEKLIKRMEYKISKEQKQEVIKEVEKRIKPCLDYCQKQNGLPYCKNCGLNMGILDKLKEKERETI